MPELAFRVNSLTTGTPSHKFEHLRVDYVYRGSKADEPISVSPGHSSGVRKRQRLARLAELEAVVPPLSLAEKARRMGLADKTVRGYLRELKAAAAQDAAS